MHKTALSFAFPNLQNVQMKQNALTVLSNSGQQRRQYAQQ
jgi:hypothetical protein